MIRIDSINPANRWRTSASVVIHASAFTLKTSQPIELYERVAILLRAVAPQSPLGAHTCKAQPRPSNAVTSVMPLKTLNPGAPPRN